MGVGISLPGASVASPLVPAPPVISGCLAWSYFGKDLTTSQNVGSGGAYSNFLAGPTWQPNYARCVNGIGAVQTPVGLSAAMTMLVVARQVPVSSPVGAAAAIIDPNAAGGPQFNFSPITGGSPGVSLFCAGTAGTLALVDAPITSFKFYAASIGGGVVPVIYDKTSALSATGGSSGTNSGSAVPLVIGSNATVNSSDNQSIDVAFAAIYNSILTPTQITNIYNAVKSSLLLRGITA